MTEALCWAHARRKFFELADLARAGKAPPAPLAVEAVRQIDAIFAHERAINGRAAADRLAYRREHAAPLVGELEAWMKSERAKLSRHADVARAMDYMLKRWPAFTRFLDDGRICLTNNAAERALRGVALGRKSWLFVGSDRGGRPRGGHVHADRHRQAQRHRPAGLARRRPRAHRQPPHPAPPRASALALAPGSRSPQQQRRLKLSTRGRAREATVVLPGGLRRTIDPRERSRSMWGQHDAYADPDRLRTQMRAPRR